MALSRQDGYWPYISTGEEPPPELVYGEFDVGFFGTILDRALELMHSDSSSSRSTTATAATTGTLDSAASSKVFCDLGSGTGRLVLTAAALYPWKLVRGIELLPGIHAQAVAQLEKCRRRYSSSSSHCETSTAQVPSPPTTKQSNLRRNGVWDHYQPFMPSNAWLNQLSQTRAIDVDNNDKDEADQHKKPWSGITTTERTSNKAGTTTTMTTTTEVDDTNFCLAIQDNQYAYTQPEEKTLPLAPIQLSCGSFTDPSQYFGDADIVFCFSSAMPYSVIQSMAQAVGQQCQPGTLLLTTEYQLPEGIVMENVTAAGDRGTSYTLQVVEEMHGPNEATGGESTVFIHRLVHN
jgi:hypothetical protein